MEDQVKRIGPLGDKYAFKCEIDGVEPFEVHVHARIADAMALPGEDLEASAESGIRMFLLKHPEFWRFEARKMPRDGRRILWVGPDDRGAAQALRRAKGLPRK